MRFGTGSIKNHTPAEDFFRATRGKDPTNTEHALGVGLELFSIAYSSAPFSSCRVPG